MELKRQWGLAATKTHKAWHDGFDLFLGLPMCLPLRREALFSRRVIQTNMNGGSWYGFYFMPMERDVPSMDKMSGIKLTICNQ
jgi:hypothetical protein